MRFCPKGVQSLISRRDHSVNMGKGFLPSVKRVHSQALKQTPAIDPPCAKHSYREVKRRSIVAGLRMMRAPAVAKLSHNKDSVQQCPQNS